MNATIIYLVVGLALGFLVSLTLQLFFSKKKSDQLEKESRKRIKESEKEARARIRDAEHSIREQYKKHQETVQAERQELVIVLKQKEESLNVQLKDISRKTQSVDDSKKELTKRLDAVNALKDRRQQLVDELNVKLENIAKMTQKEAEDELIRNVERRSRDKAGKIIKTIESQANKVAKRKAKEIVLAAIENTAVEHVLEHSTASVKLPDDEMKGRIIGKEGRNIRAFESAIGVDVIVDDSPNMVILSCFDPIRRQLGKLCMEMLVSDGRIHPTRIEECIEKARQKINETIQERGEAAAEEIGLEFHPKLIEMIGRLYYRTSYGQNILIHSLEAAKVAGRIALELDVNVDLAKRGSMLHDIGKAIDFEQEGSHDDLGAALCRKYGESEELINCIMAHHEDEAPETVEAVIVKVADAISSARPGARKESVELYLKRLEKLETLAQSFEGVEQAYAIQAGREIRVLVRPEDVKDDGMQKIAQDIAQLIEQEIDSPGEVKVSLVRETRVSSIAH